MVFFHTPIELALSRKKNVLNAIAYTSFEPDFFLGFGTHLSSQNGRFSVLASWVGSTVSV